jgi:membrane protease YdiL (CAAX protease family)
MATTLDETFAPEEHEWTCSCGRTYAAGVDLCPACGRPAPRAAVRRGADSRWDEQIAWTPRVRGVRFALLATAANIVFQTITLTMFLNGSIESSRAMELATWGGVAFYAFTLAAVALPFLSLRPRWVKGDSSTALFLGVGVGLAVAAGLLGIARIATGRVVLDPSVRGLVSEGTVFRIAITTGVVVVLAPFVEEILFRGVVAESLRRKGTFVALVSSSFLFALIHLRTLPYYTAMGLVLGGLYWKRGLLASVAAHAAFNGCLLVMAVAVVLGPDHTIAANGVSLKASAGWERTTIALPDDVSLALDGPSGASLVVRHAPLPGGARTGLDQVAAAINSGALPPPAGWEVAPGSAHVTQYAAGPGVEVAVRVHGHDGVIAMIPKGEAFWEVDIATAGSGRAGRDYPAILQSLQLP